MTLCLNVLRLLTMLLDQSCQLRWYLMIVSILVTEDLVALVEVGEGGMI